jgi:hypothetical protein
VADPGFTDVLTVHVHVTSPSESATFGPSSGAPSVTLAGASATAQVDPGLVKNEMLAA